jgi:putative ABC transport system permease protein
MSLIFSIAATIAIVLSCSGHDLVDYSATGKRNWSQKSIGTQCTAYFLPHLKRFLKLVFLAILLAIPIAWFTMNKWLEDFPLQPP